MRNRIWMVAALALTLGAVGCRDNVDEDEIGGQTADESRKWEDIAKERDVQAGEGDFDADLQSGNDAGDLFKGFDEDKELQAGRAAPARTGEMKAFIVDHADESGITLRAEGAGEKKEQAGSEVFISNAEFARLSGSTELPSVGEKVKASVGADGKATKIERMKDSTGAEEPAKEPLEPKL